MEKKFQSFNIHHNNNVSKLGLEEVGEGKHYNDM